MVRFVLGSASPRRKRLLSEAGYTFDICVTDAEEIRNSGNPVGTVTHNAIAKNIACRKICPDRPVLTADTLVWFNGELVGKPKDREDAVRMLTSFSGEEQTVFTAVAVSFPGDEKPEVRTEATIVRFKILTREIIDEYLDNVKPFDRAGAYDISENGGLIIDEISGSYTNVVGLPVESAAFLLDRQIKN